MSFPYGDICPRVLLIENFACPLAAHNGPSPGDKATGFITQPTAKRALRKEAKSKMQRWTGHIRGEQAQERMGKWFG